MIPYKPRSIERRSIQTIIVRSSISVMESNPYILIVKSLIKATRNEDADFVRHYLQCDNRTILIPQNIGYITQKLSFEGLEFLFSNLNETSATIILEYVCISSHLFSIKKDNKPLPILLIPLLIRNKAKVTSKLIRVLTSRTGYDDVVNVFKAIFPYIPKVLTTDMLCTNIATSNSKVTKFLTMKGCDPNVRDVCGYSPLHRTTSPDVISCLVSAGADINILDTTHNSPLKHHVLINNSIKGYLKSVKKLIELGADVSDTIDLFDSETMSYYESLKNKLIVTKLTQMYDGMCMIMDYDSFVTKNLIEINTSLCPDMFKELISYIE